MKQAMLIMEACDTLNYGMLEGMIASLAFFPCDIPMCGTVYLTVDQIEINIKGLT